MRKRVILCASVLALMTASDAAAQSSKWAWTPLGGRVFLSINGLVQPGDQTVDRASSFDLYDETGDFRSTQTIEGSSLLDIGGGYRILKNVGAGVAYTRFTTTGTAAISGAIPHPLVFDRPRAYSATAADLIHKEQAVHLFGILYIPFVKNVDFAVFGGPSFFNDVDQDFPLGISFSENGAPFDTVTLTEIREGRGSSSSTGFNVGGEVTYSITRNLGAGLMVRYTRADVDYDVGGIKSSIKAGNTQVGGGVRLRF